MVAIDSTLSDAEIAQKLGLKTEQVTEIRCRAEVEALDPETLREAEHWKKKKAAQILEPER